MPEDNEKVDDFISLWKKKMTSEDKSPSVIRDTLNKMSALQQENEELRKKITQNIDLISRSEEIIRKSVEASCLGNATHKEKYRMTIQKDNNISDVDMHVTTAPFCYEDDELVLLILEDITDAVTLKRLLPICAS